MMAINTETRSLLEHQRERIRITIIPFKKALLAVKNVLSTATTNTVKAMNELSTTAWKTNSKQNVSSDVIVLSSRWQHQTWKDNVICPRGEAKTFLFDGKLSVKTTINSSKVMQIVITIYTKYVYYFLIKMCHVASVNAE